MSAIQRKKLFSLMKGWCWIRLFVSVVSIGLRRPTPISIRGVMKIYFLLDRTFLVSKQNLTIVLFFIMAENNLFYKYSLGKNFERRGEKNNLSNDSKAHIQRRAVDSLRSKRQISVWSLINCRYVAMVKRGSQCLLTIIENTLFGLFIF